MSPNREGGVAILAVLAAAIMHAQGPTLDKRWVCDADITYYDGNACLSEELHLGAACVGWGSIQGLPFPDLVFGSLETKVREGTPCAYPQLSPNHGKVFIFPGPQPCLSALPCEETREPYVLTYATENPSDPWISNNLGWAITYLGDLDGDGNDELAFSAPLQDVGSNADAGTVYVLFMADPHVFSSQYVAGIDEFDLEVAPATSTPTNQSGFNIVRIRGVSANDWFGHSHAGPGNVTFDSTPDLVVGAPHRADLSLGAGELQTGRVYVIDGSALASAATTMRNGFGALGGDAVELVLSVSEGGNAKLLTPLSSGADHPAARLGWSVTGIGDLDGDSRVELALGAPEAYFDCDSPVDPQAGAWTPEPSSGATGFVEIIGFDSDGDPELRFAIRGESDFDMFGWSVNGLGAAPGQSGGNATDDQGSPVPDLLVGAIGYDILLGENERLDDVGKAYLISGAALISSGSTVIQLPHAIEVFSLEGTQEDEVLGESVAGGGVSVETPGFALFAVGSRRYSDNTLPSCVSPLEEDCEWVIGNGGILGRAQTFAFLDSTYVQIGDYTGDRLRSRLGYGTGLAWLPDMNGSGDSELLVGAPAWQPEVGRSPCNGEEACQRPGRAYVLFQLEGSE